jgi:hypothetical protein
MSPALKEKPYGEELPVTGAAGMILDGRYLPPPEDKDGKLWVRTSALIQADPQDLYDMWRNAEAAPAWQEQITQVVSTGEKTSHWVMESDGKTIEWDSEVVADAPGKRIAWRSIGGDSDNAGEVVFEDAPGGRGTMVTVLQEFRMGKLAMRLGDVCRSQSETGSDRESAALQGARRNRRNSKDPGTTSWRPRRYRKDEGIHLRGDGSNAFRVGSNRELGLFTSGYELEDL